MRREMIGGFVVGMIAGDIVDLLFKTSGLGLIGGAVLGGVVGYFLIPARDRAALRGGGADGYSDSGDLSWMSAADSSSACDDSGSDGGGCDGGGDGSGGD